MESFSIGNMQLGAYIHRDCLFRVNLLVLLVNLLFNALVGKCGDDGVHSVAQIDSWM